jgi:hypothetical protein
MNPPLIIALFVSSLLTACDNTKNLDKKDNQITPLEIFSDTQTVAGYKKRVVFIKAIDRGDYFYIPQAAFSDSIDAVLIQDKRLMKIQPDNRQVILSWNSDCEGGAYFILTITPEQIFFSTGHEDPNPSFLYWILDISKEQFQAINYGVRKRAPKNFYDVTAPRKDSLSQDESEYHYVDTSFRDPCAIPEDWNDSTERHFNICCNNSIATHSILFFEILNNYIPSTVNKLKLPNVQESLAKFPKYFSVSKEEIFDWAPTKIKNN